MTDTAPDEEPDDVARASHAWLERLINEAARAPLSLWPWGERRRPAPLEDALLLLYASRHAMTAQNELPAGTQPEPVSQTVTVVEITSLTDDSPPSDMGVDGVFVIYEH